MTTETLPHHDDHPHWPTVLAALIVGACFFSLWIWLLPPVLGFRIDAARSAGWRWIAAIPSILGFALFIRCVWHFGRTGRGTPAPFAPPQRLVVVGPYRYVRNPMYLGFVIGWLGLWIVFGEANLTALVLTVFAALGVLLFVRFYEEPTLRYKFGADFELYCRNVPRWLPRTHPWTPPNETTN